MGPLDAPPEELHALESGRAFADLSTYRKVRVTGGDARGWLNDLITCDVASLAPGMSRRSLLLTPSGHIRSDFMIASDDKGFVLLQAPDRPEAIGDLLARYVLSSDVELRDIGAASALIAVLDSEGHEAGFAPSVLGPGYDLMPAMEPEAPLVIDGLRDRGLVRVGAAAAEVWRIRRGDPRMGVDFDERALPAEVGLGFAIDAAKGCFLGQESVARVRNLGHPPRLLRHVRADDAFGAGAPLLLDGRQVGAVMSAATEGAAGTVGLAMVEWKARTASLVTSDGIDLVAVGSLD